MNSFTNEKIVFTGYKSFQFEGDLDKRENDMKFDQNLNFMLRGNLSENITTNIQYDDQEEEKLKYLRFRSETEHLTTVFGDLDRNLLPEGSLTNEIEKKRGLHIKEAEDEKIAFFITQNEGKKITEDIYYDGRMGAYMLREKNILTGSDFLISRGKTLIRNVDYALDYQNGILTFVEDQDMDSVFILTYRILNNEIATSKDYTMGFVTSTNMADTKLNLLYLGETVSDGEKLVGLNQRYSRNNFNSKLEIMNSGKNDKISKSSAMAFGADYSFNNMKLSFNGKKTGDSFQTNLISSTSRDYNKIIMDLPKYSGLKSNLEFFSEENKNEYSFNLKNRKNNTVYKLKREELDTDSKINKTVSNLFIKRNLGKFINEMRIINSLEDESNIKNTILNFNSRGKLGKILTRMDMNSKDINNEKSLLGKFRTKYRLNRKTLVSTSFSGKLDNYESSDNKLLETKMGTSLTRSITNRLRTSADIQKVDYLKGDENEKTRSFVNLILSMKYKPFRNMEFLNRFTTKKGRDFLSDNEISKDTLKIGLRYTPAENIECRTGYLINREIASNNNERLNGEIIYTFKKGGRIKAFLDRDISSSLKTLKSGIDLNYSINSMIETIFEISEDRINSSQLNENKILDRKGLFKFRAKI